ncbi:hypothetical protein ACIPUF_04115 [Pectobacterium sp. CHL-2024]|uniref:hypothetical protein n=1 Tax=Pectobacterium sp. CHL-2024 TaxID=3377079 RepID=UPI003819EA08
MLDKLSLPWRSIYSLYNGILGKTLLIISLATPISLIYSSIHLIPSSYPTILSGALLALTGFIYTEISIPPLIKDFKNSHQYSSEILNIAENVDWVSEFKILEDNIHQLSEVKDGYFSYPIEFKSIDYTKKLLGEEKAIRSLSMMKFDLCNKESKYKRLFMTLIFYISLTLIFSSTISNIYSILIG